MWISRVLQSFLQRVAKPSVKACSVPEPALDHDESDYRVISSEEARLAYATGPVYLSSNESFSIHGHIIAGPAFLCSGAPDPEKEDPAVIYPQLAVERSEPTTVIGYWPAYYGLEPAQRNAYLHWLATDHGQSTDLGHVFLYLATMERYVYSYAHRTEDKETVSIELDYILAELERLLGLYGFNRSFAQYAGGLVEAIYILHRITRYEEAFPRFPGLAPALIRHAIARHARLTPETPLSAELAYQWALAKQHPYEPHKPGVFDYFEFIYHTESEKGLSLPKGTKTLTVDLRPSSKGLPECKGLQFTGLTDIFDSKSAVKTLLGYLKVANEQHENLVGLTPNTDPVTALRIWKDQIKTGHPPPVIRNAIESIRSNLLEGSSKIYADLCEYLGVTAGPSIRRHTMGEINQLLDLCQLSVVPNSIHIPRQPSLDEMCVLVPQSLINELSEEGQSVLVVMRLVHKVVFAHTPERDDQDLAQLLEVFATLNNDLERVLLEGYLAWFAVSPPITRGQKQFKDIADGPAHIQKLVASRVVVTVLKILEPTPKVLRTLVAELRKIGVPAEDLPRYLHQLEQSQTDVPVPTSEPTMEPAVYSLDRSRITRHQADTDQVQNVLSSIFEEEESATCQPAVTPPREEPSSVADQHWFSNQLSGAHATFAIWIVQFEEISMGEITDKCRSLSLPAEGAMEAINDVAYDILGDALIEISEPVLVYRDLLEGE